MFITSKTHITEIQKMFRDRYPHLKLEFFKVKHFDRSTSPLGFKYNEDHLLEDLNPDLKAGQIEWFGEMTVSELESYMEDTFGLHIQVYRKSGELWLQTSATDSWELQKQEEKGS